VLFTPDRHEPVDDRPFSDAAAREAIAKIAARAERELDTADGRWPLDPADAQSEEARPESGLGWGAAGIAWALGELATEGYASSAVVDRELVEALEARILAEPDAPDFAVGGVWTGVAGVMAVAERRWPDESRRDRLAEVARAALVSPALEPMFGHPGHMLLAAQLHERTGEERWAALWSAGAERLLAEWQYDEALQAWVWTQHLGREVTRYVGAAHGLAGNLHVLLRGGSLLPPDQRAGVESRAVQTLTRLAVVEDGRANWPGVAGGPLVANDRIRVQWCHGAPGVLTALWNAAPEDDAWGELLLAAGQLVWEAGPLRHAPGLCHGTAGNAYALLAVWRRTGDEQWLERARAFAQHAAAQVEERAQRLGHGRHSLLTGDEGVALCLASCLAGDERVPIADRLI
jgi:lanthionine synthetase-like protein